MKSIDFPESNLALAKDQPKYQTLYVYVNRDNKEFPMTMCFELSKEEIDQINKTGKLFFTQITFGHGFNPINMSVLSPFDEHENLQQPADENRTPSDVWDKTHYKGTEGTIYPGQGYVIHGPCANCGKEESNHFWSTRQCEI